MVLEGVLHPVGSICLESQVQGPEAAVGPGHRGVVTSDHVALTARMESCAVYSLTLTRSNISFSEK